MRGLNLLSTLWQCPRKAGMAGRYIGSYLGRSNGWRAVAILADIGQASLVGRIPIGQLGLWLSNKDTRGGARAGAGRWYSPWHRIELNERFIAYRYKFNLEGVPNPVEAADDAMYAEDYPHGEPKPGHKDRYRDTLRKLRVRGRVEDILLTEGDPEILNLLPTWEQRQRRRWRRRRWIGPLHHGSEW
jgi:hypothetical protein